MYYIIIEEYARGSTYTDVLYKKKNGGYVREGYSIEGDKPFMFLSESRAKEMAQTLEKYYNSRHVRAYAIKY